MPLAFLQVQVSSCNLSYLAAAFVASWVVFFVYVFFVSRRQQELRREIGDLINSLSRQGATDGD